MKYCEKCHTLYSSDAASCPKCGVQEPASEAADTPAPESRGARVRDWIWLAVGIPLFIGFIYLIVYIIKTIG